MIAANTYTDRPGYRGLLAAVLAQPADDLSRLVLADWLDEHEQPDRADFIRVQIELAKGSRCQNRRGRSASPGGPPPCGDCHVCDLDDREAEHFAGVESLLNLPAGVSPRLVDVLESETPGVVVRRGFVAEVYCTEADWYGAGRTVGTHGDRCNGGRLTAPNPQFTRECWVCHGTGRTVGIGPAVVAAHPVERVVLTDGVRVDRIESGPDAGKWLWLFTGTPPDGIHHAAGGFASRELAEADYSNALLAWAKSHAADHP